MINIDNIEIDKDFSECRKIETFMIRLSPKFNYIFKDYLIQMDIDNGSHYVRNLIKRDINEKLELGLVEFK